MRERIRHERRNRRSKNCLKHFLPNKGRGRGCRGDLGSLELLASYSVTLTHELTQSPLLSPIVSAPIISSPTTIIIMAAAAASPDVTQSTPSSPIPPHPHPNHNPNHRFASFNGAPWLTTPVFSSPLPPLPNPTKTLISPSSRPRRWRTPTWQT